MLPSIPHLHVDAANVGDKATGRIRHFPRTARAEEDDGWRMGFVIDEKSGPTDYVILDARNFSGSPHPERPAPTLSEAVH